MALRIHLLQGQNYVYTNLDTIAGKVSLQLPRDETFSQIVVKLECESRTRLAAPREGRRNERYETELEVHKLLYKTDVVFPSSHLQSLAPGQRAAYTLPYGQHEWPFNFRIPFNNACAPVNSLMDRMQMTRDFNQHIKRPLPPSLSGFPGMCEIRYYVKCTCQRTSLFKENFRAEASFKFFPIEPVRSPPSKRESFARRQHQFSPSPSLPLPGGFFKNSPRPNSAGGPPPIISIDGRLPDPAIVTCNEPLPLRVLVKKLNDTNQTIYLNTFQIMLIGHTKVRAHELSRVEQTSWVIVSQANMRMPLGNSGIAKDTEMVVDKKLWDSIPLPNAVCPNFETCNVSRKYELKISAGLTYGSLNDIKPEMTMQELYMPCKVYSGIEPPAALVEEMFKRQQQQDHPIGSAYAVRPPVTSGASGLSGAPTAATQPTSSDPMAPPLYTPAAPNVAAHNASSSEMPDEPPPSYEDAMAEDIGPVDGPRRQYEQPQTAPVVGDEKRSSSFGR